MKLTEPQTRHLRELYGDGEKKLYWRMAYGSPEHRCAVALERLGLVALEGSLISRARDGGYYLTEQGREVAATLRRP